jgi:two-component system response regulator DevR
MPPITASPIRLLLIDDSALVREGIRALVAADPTAHDIEIVGEADTVACGITVAREVKPHVVLLDIRLPDGNGFVACRQILKDTPATRVIILTSFTNDQFVYDAITSGAQGYLMKEIDPSSLIAGIHDVHDGRSILSPDVTAGVMRMMRNGGVSQQPGDLTQLSAQERRVLALVAEGKTNKQIGNELNLSDNTVKNYLCNVFDKLQVRRRSQAAALYVQSYPVKGGEFAI